MKTMTVKTKILFFVLATTAISFLILGAYNSYTSYKSEYILIKEKESTLATQTAKYINTYLESKLEVLKAVKESLKEEKLDKTNPNIIKKLHFGEKAGKIDSFYIGLEDNGDYFLGDGQIWTTSTKDYDPRKRPWYKQALKENKPGITDPYVDFATKKFCITFFDPLYIDGKLIGVVGADLFIDTIVDTVLQVSINGMGSAHLSNDIDVIIIHKDKKKIKQEDTLLSQIKTSENSGFGSATEDGLEQLVSYSTIPLAKWKIIIKLESDIIYKEINSNIMTEIFLYLVLLVVILGIIFYILNTTLSPIKTLEEGFEYFFQFLKGKESTIKHLNINSKDEFGKMSMMINKEMDTIEGAIKQDRELIEEVKEVVAIVSERKFDKRITNSTTTQSLNELKNLLNDMLDKLEIQVGKDMNLIIKALKSYTNRDFTAKLDESSGNIGQEIMKMNTMITEMLQGSLNDGLILQQSANNLKTNIQTLNKNATNQAASLEETAASIEEITSNIEQTNHKAKQMNLISSETKNSASQGKKLANNTVQAMDDINNTVMNINEAIAVIDQIAFQTNILSLNAAVEAATAGEAGKGFAVVAGEVRNLAARSAEAAKDIKDLVEEATQKANSGKNISSSMIEGFTQLEEKIVDTSKLIEDVTLAAGEQTLGMRQIADAMALLDKITQENASIADKTNLIAQETNSIAKVVVENVNKNNFNGKN